MKVDEVEAVPVAEEVVAEEVKEEAEVATPHKEAALQADAKQQEEEQPQPEKDAPAEVKPEARTVVTDVETAPTASTATVSEDTTTGTTRSKKRPRSPSEPDEMSSVVTAAVTAASAAAAAQLSASMGWNGLYTLLSATSFTSATNLPTVDQVKQAAQKFLSEYPPFVHLSKTDSAPQLKILDDHRLRIKGGMRGYRMSRATHGISQGLYYYEVLILDPPKVSEIVASFPSNIRMGNKLQEQVKVALAAEKEGKPADPTGFGGHVRLGFSNRTGDLQAPVGYDKWSYAIRDIGGSRIHASKRDDTWGGETFGPGDVIGCAISILPSKETPANVAVPAQDGKVPALNPETNSHSDQSDEPKNYIRFFKNGIPMGQTVVSRGKRESVMAFYIPDGVYYPAISLYMGASVYFNSGPHFIYSPRKSTFPSGFKLKPVSDLCARPMTVEDAVAKVQKEKAFRKPEMLQKFQELVQTEVQAQQDAYASFRKKHVQDIIEQRKKRGLKFDDLEQDEFYENEN